MLTQDDFVAPNMSGETQLQHSSWKAEAIRRGDLKISGPIPITEDVPLNEEEEKEYAETGKIASPLLPPDARTQQIPPQDPPPAPQSPPPAPPNIQHEAPQENTNPVEERPQPREEHHELRHEHSSSNLRETGEMQRRSFTEPVPYSAPSPFPSILESSAKTAPKKKRKSGLRHVFRKMFGRRSRSEQPEEEEETTHRGHSHHDPGLLRQSLERRPPVRGPRISDLPVKEPEPFNPLGQHLPFPMNVNAPQETSPPHEYLTFEAPAPNLGRRRATLPSVFANAEIQSLNGQRRRLEPWEERRDDESIPSPQIGIALSSPPHAPAYAHSIQSKRRSRSAGALRDLAKGLPSVERRRSAEIRHWRNSYASGSIYSSNAPRPRTAQTVETVQTADSRDTRAAESATELDNTSGPTVAQHNQDLSEIQLPVEAFNFGNLKSGFSDDEDSEPTAPPPAARSENRLSIEDRVKHLEDNMRTLETSVRRLSGRSNRQTIVLENAPKGRRSRDRSASATSQRQGSHHSSRSSNHTLHLRQHQENVEAPAPGSPPLSAAEENEFRSSTSIRDTVIAIEQRPSSPQHAEIASQLKELYDSLLHERHARKALEAQVSTLQRELADLQTLVNKLICTTSPSYPTPSPDAIVNSGEERMPTPRASTQVQGTVESVGGGWIRAAGGCPGSEKGSRGGVSVTSSREDITSPEAWATPKEENGFGSGFFGVQGSRSREVLKTEDEIF